MLLCVGCSAFGCLLGSPPSKKRAEIWKFSHRMNLTSAVGDTGLQFMAFTAEYKSCSAENYALIKTAGELQYPMSQIHCSMPETAQ